MSDEDFVFDLGEEREREGLWGRVYEEEEEGRGSAWDA